jgi:hypothetical protein
MKLISMTDFVLDQFSKLEKTQEINILQFRNNIGNYANFLKQPLTLGMFVPCDDNGNVLEKPREFKNKFSTFEIYQQARERCLFEGFSVRKMEGWNILDFPNNQHSKDFSVFEDAFKDMTIEDIVKYNLQLTPTAIKQIGL